jgi:S1-C subfamily serine protease/Tfp pilus assembly protein PilF
LQKVILMRCRPLLVVLLVALALSPHRSQGQDLRDQFGTQSLKAARALSQAVTLARAKKLKDALTAVESAIKADPRFQMGYYWKGMILADLGEIDDSLTAYKKALSDDVVRNRHISAHAANNLALTSVRLEKYEAANFWFSRAILEDSANTSQQRAKAYRNMAISLRNQGKPYSAAVAITLASRDRFPDVTPQMLNEFTSKIKDEEYAAVLHFGDRLPRLEKRHQETRLREVSLKDNPTETIIDLLSDPQGRYIVAIPPGLDHYYVVTTGDKPTVTRVAGVTKAACVCMAGGHLYFLQDGKPSRILQQDVTSGKTVATIELRGSTTGASSLVVLPAHALAFFCAGEIVHFVRLATGEVGRTEIPGQVLAGHPNQRILYSYLKPKRNVGGGMVLVNGKPVYFRKGPLDWQQTTLFQSVVTPTGPLLSAMRENVASNPTRMSISPDGRWVAVAGEGGFRPRKGTGGYGVAVLGGIHLSHLQGFYKTDATPLGVSFNPVTNQVVAVRAADARVYHLNDPNASVEVKGKFNGVSAWSGNGRYLALANTISGLTVRENTLTAGETARGPWWKSIKVEPLVSEGATAQDKYEPVETLKTFTSKAPSRKELTAELELAASKGRVDRPGRSQFYAPYVKDPAHRKALEGVFRRFREKQETGILIFTTRKELKAFPDSVVLHLWLARALKNGGQDEEAEKAYLFAIRNDAGRTDVSCAALNELAALLSGRKDELAALHCLAHSLYLDRVNPTTLTLARPLMEKHRLETLAGRFARLAEDTDLPRGEPVPALPLPGEAGPKKTSAELYKLAVPSVVLVQAGPSRGSGVCIARSDIILTNDHVIAKGGDIFVYPFAWKDKELVRLPKVRARAIYRSPEQDIAVLKLGKADLVKPLPVLAASPSAGEKVYAIGSPGLGAEVLEQTISEGLISSTRRKIGNVLYLQHSAAINPGNSGGPLLNEHGQVVGIVTLKARLEGVSFAVRVEAIRKLFKGR